MNDLSLWTWRVIQIFYFSASEDEAWPKDSSVSQPYLPPAKLAPPQPLRQAPEYSPPSPPSPCPPSPPAPAMVSRRAIISRSRDDLQHHLGVNNKNFTGEDQWFSKEKLYKVRNILLCFADPNRTIYTARKTCTFNFNALNRTFFMSRFRTKIVRKKIMCDVLRLRTWMNHKDPHLGLNMMNMTVWNHLLLWVRMVKRKNSTSVIAAASRDR